jgi:chromosomal replication initiator protein
MPLTPTQLNYWPLILDSLKKKVSATVYKTWFKQLNLLAIENNGTKAVLEVSSNFNKKYLQNKYSSFLKEAINRYFPRIIHLDFKISNKQDKKELLPEDVFAFTENSAEQDKALDLKSKNKSLQIKLEPYQKKNINNLNPKYTFETFIPNNSNRLALSVAEAVLKKPGVLYNPVFIYSGVGLGKTHLLQAIGHKFLEQKPDAKIKYSTCETFFNYFISSVKNKESKDFKEYFRNIDILLIDDIQFICGKEATQEAFFHTFNELHQQNKQIILTSDKPPKALENVAERLLSRFEWGVVIDISKPELEDRIMVLKDKVERMKLNLQQDQILKIANVVNTNFRDLEGVLNRIEARIKLIPDIPLEDFELNKILANYSDLSSTIEVKLNNTILTAEKTLQVVCQVCGVEKAEIMSKSRQKDIAIARQILMYLLKEELDMSYPAIGKFFKRDHSTALHGHKAIIKKKALDSKLNQKINFIKQSLIA